MATKEKQEMDRAINALALELPQRVWIDFHFLWMQYQNSLNGEPSPEQDDRYLTKMAMSLTNAFDESEPSPDVNKQIEKQFAEKGNRLKEVVGTLKELDYEMDDMGTLRHEPSPVDVDKEIIKELEYQIGECFGAMDKGATGDELTLSLNDVIFDLQDRIDLFKSKNR